MNKSSSHPSFPPGLAIFIAILAVSTASIFIRFAQGSAPSLVIAAYRLLFATLLLAPFTLPKEHTEIQNLLPGQIALAGLSGIFLAFHFASWITSLEYTSVASSVVLVTTAPLWVALFSPLFLKEPLSRTVLIGMVIALAGGMIVGISDACKVSAAGIACPSLSDFFSGKAFLGDVLALLGALLSAGYLMIGRRLRPVMSLGVYTFMVYGIGALVLLGLLGVTHEKLVGYPPIIYGWFLALAIIPQLLGHSTLNWSLRYLPATYVSIALLGEPVGSTILAYFLLHEVPNPLKIAGGVFILVGIFLSSRWERTAQVAETA